ncbi:MAG: SPFH/Band 7/PHB domain protein [Alphaproteobacteria bacterium]|nr:SPFH/Band 7/PHB domain protein [Alphaproteobacteria bacterium]
MQFAVILLILVLFILAKSVVIVRQGYEYTIESFGRFTRTLKPGFHLVIPIIERIGAKINRMEQVLDVPSQDVITKDNAMVRVDGVLFFQIQNAANAAYQVRDLNSAILNLIMTNIRTVLGSMEIDELLSQRDAINHKLLSVVDEATVPWGVKVTRVEIKDITPPRDLIDSMARQMKAERDKRAAILEAEGVRQSEILKAEGEKQAMILSAEAEKQSVILDAEAKKEAAFREAEARERLANAESMATTVLSDAIAKGNAQSLNYFLGQKYIEALQGFANSSNQKLLMLPADFTNVASSLASIAEITKEVIKDKEPAKKAK